MTYTTTLSKAEQRRKEYQKRVNPSQYRYKIGIDPGIRCGFAVWDSKEKIFIEIRTTNIYDLLHHLLINYSEEWTRFQEGVVYIENPNTFVPFEKISKEEIEARRQGAGAVKQTFRHIIEFLEDRNIPYVTTRLQGGLKKVSSKWFKEKTGWKKSTDEHGRDAALMVWQR